MRRRAVSRTVRRVDRRTPDARSSRDASVGSASRRIARNASSSEARPGSTSWTLPPAWTIAATRSGTRSGASPANVKRSPSTAGAPKAASRSTGSASSVTRRLTTGAPISRSGGPIATTRPRSRMATRPQLRSTSPSRWLLSTTVLPRSAASRTIARTSSRPSGSSAEVGSSRMTSSGSPSSATARPRRCCMPFEKSPTRSVTLIDQADDAQDALDLARLPGRGQTGESWWSARTRSGSARRGSGRAPAGSRRGLGRSGHRVADRGSARSRRCGA